MKNYVLFFILFLLIIQSEVFSQGECNGSIINGICCDSCTGICCHPEADVYCLGTTAVPGDCPDFEPPAYSKNVVNTTAVGTSCEFRLEWNDNYWLNNSGGYIFSTNNSGTWKNSTWTAFTTTPQNATAFTILNSTSGTVVAWCYYANDTSGNEKNTNCQSNNWFYLTTTESVKPKYSNDNDNSSLYGSYVTINVPIKIFVKWDDNYKLSTAILRRNVSGWANVSVKYFSTGSDWYNTTYTTSPTDDGKTICWNQWSNDTANNWNATMSNHCFTVKVPDFISPTYSYDSDTSGGFAEEEEQLVNVSTLWSDNKGLSSASILHNETGVWIVNSISLSGTPRWYNYTIDTTNHEGKTICWYQNATDTSGNTNNSMSFHCFNVFSSAQTTQPNPIESLFESIVNSMRVSSTNTSTKIATLIIQFLGILALTIMLIILVESVLEAK